MSGIWKNLFLKFVHGIHGLQKMGKESKDIFNNIVALSKKLELDLQKDDFTELLAVLREDRLMRT